MWWLLVFLVALIIEIATVSLFGIWFAAGALAAFVVSLFTDIWWVQILVFLLVSLVLVIFTRPVAERYLNKDRTKTNVDANIGRQGVVIETIDNLKPSGEVNLAGQMWMARSKNDKKKIPAGARVVVREIQGVKLIVDECEEEV